MPSCKKCQSQQITKTGISKWLYLSLRENSPLFFCRVGVTQLSIP